jgi:undecaprenyl-diphosphatase
MMVMGKKENLALLILFSLALIFSLLFDQGFSRFFASLRNNFLTEILLGVTFMSSQVIIFFFLTSLFLWREHKRRWIFPLWASLIASLFVSFVLKISIERLRPFQSGVVSLPKILESFSYSTWDFSLPSGHAVLAFSAIPILAMEFPKFKKVWIALAILIGLSRVYFGLHYLSDILIGGAIGLWIGFLMVKLETKKKYGERIRRLFKK